MAQTNITATETVDNVQITVTDSDGDAVSISVSESVDTVNLTVTDNAGPSTAANHGLLLGLGDDDHTQYLLADGTRTLSGNLTVTGTVDGRDVATDGTKLDGIESGATADQTDAEILTAWGAEGYFHKALASTGILAGADLSINADTTKYDLAAGKAVIVDMDDAAAPVVNLVEWTAQTALALGKLATEPRTNIALSLSNAASTDTVFTNSFSATVNGSSQTVYIAERSSDNFDSEQSRDFARIGRLVHTSGAAITNAVNLQWHIESPMAALVTFLSLFSPQNVNGNAFSGVAATAGVQKTLGHAYRFGSNFSADSGRPDIQDIPAANPTSHFYRYQDGAGGFSQSASTAVLDGTKYDDGSGTLQTVNNNRFTAQPVWVFAGSGTMFIQYGQEVFASQAAAINSLATDDPVLDQNLVDDAVFRGWFIVAKNIIDTTDASQFIWRAPLGELGAGTGGQTVVDLQAAYEASADPEIQTDATRGALTVRRGSAADSDNIFEGQNGAGTNTAQLTGAGALTLDGAAQASNLSGTNTGDEPDATTTVKGIVELATDGEALADKVVQGNDSRLSDARTPTAHTHVSADITDAVSDASGTSGKLLKSDAFGNIQANQIKSSGTLDAGAGGANAGSINPPAAGGNSEVTIPQGRSLDTLAVTGQVDGSITAADVTDFDTEVSNNTDVAANKSKLAGIEAGATADQTGAEIKALYEAELDTNAFTDADHSKLDGIESAATADQTAAEILTAIKTVDGTGSGLDADLLDGQEATAFAASSHTHVSADITDTTSDGNANPGQVLVGSSEDPLKVAQLQSVGSFKLGAASTDQGELTTYGVAGTGQINLDASNVTTSGTRQQYFADGAGTIALTSQTDGSIHADDLDFAGSTEIGADLADADEILVSDGGGNTTRRKSLVSRIWTYVKAKIESVTISTLDISGDLTVSGQVTLSGQAASEDDSAMTRSLVESWLWGGDTYLYKEEFENTTDHFPGHTGSAGINHGYHNGVTGGAIYSTGTTINSVAFSSPMEANNLNPVNMQAWEYNSRLKIRTSVASVRVRVGFSNSGSMATWSGFEYDSALNANWRFYDSDNATYSDTGVAAAADTWVAFKMRSNGTNNQIVWSVDGGSETTRTTARDYVHRIGQSIENLAASDKSMVMDYVSFVGHPTR